jgi:hypothetical protein
MNVYVTAVRSPHGRIEYVLKQGDEVLATLIHHSTVENAYQEWLRASKKEFDYRSSGYSNPDLPSCEWDEELSNLNLERHMKSHRRALQMVATLEPHRNAPFVEAEWQKEERLRKERQAAEAIKAVYRVEKQTKDKSSNAEPHARKSPERKAALLSEIDKLVGLKSVKQDVRTMINHLKIQQARKTKGLKTTELSLHMVLRQSWYRENDGSQVVVRNLLRTWSAAQRPLNRNRPFRAGWSIHRTDCSQGEGDRH